MQSNVCICLRCIYISLAITSSSRCYCLLYPQISGLKGFLFCAENFCLRACKSLWFLSGHDQVIPANTEGRFLFQALFQGAYSTVIFFIALNIKIIIPSREMPDNYLSVISFNLLNGAKPLVHLAFCLNMLPFCPEFLAFTRKVLASG